MISYVISYMISVRLQPPILPRHSALMQTMVGMSVMLTWIEKWMPTRSVTMLTKTQELWAAASDTPKRNLEWTAGELNVILENNLVPSHHGKGQLRTFGCIQWECELYSGRPKARCYPFNMQGHRFRGKNCQVLHMI